MAYHCEKGTKECDGCMMCKPTIQYFCPICGKEIYETVFVTNDGEIIGCENCAHMKEPHEVFTDETD